MNSSLPHYQTKEKKTNMEQDQELYNVDTTTLKERMQRWRIDYVENINSHIANHTDYPKNNR